MSKPEGQGADRKVALLAAAAAADAELHQPPPGDGSEKKTSEGDKTPPPGGPGPEASGPPLEVQIAGVFAMTAGAIAPLLPRTAAIYDEATCDGIGKVLAPLARKYGLDRYLSGFSFGEEIQALLVVGPIVLATREAIRQDLGSVAPPKAEPKADPKDVGGHDATKEPIKRTPPIA